tara:strand:+ start:121 stop:462 length:342 start_codon:yes stop_codon:yes gene_type:complete
MIQTINTNSNKIDTLGKINFNRRELNPILRIYGQMVSCGEWRDYSISSFHSRAVFSIFRRTSETPLYNIVKKPKNFKKHGRYLVITMDGQIISNGNTLERVLRVFERRFLKII